MVHASDFFIVFFLFVSFVSTVQKWWSGARCGFLFWFDPILFSIGFLQIFLDWKWGNSFNIYQGVLVRTVVWCGVAWVFWCLYVSISFLTTFNWMPNSTNITQGVVLIFHSLNWFSSSGFYLRFFRSFCAYTIESIEFEAEISTWRQSIWQQQ